MMTGILEIDEGKILIDNINIEKNPVGAKEKLGVVLDNPDTFLKLRGIEYLKFIDKTRKWLNNELCKKKINLDNIFYAFYKDDEIYVIENEN